MSDVIDQAQKFEALNLSQSLTVQRAKADATPKPVPRGHCLYPDCDEPFSSDQPNRIYCGPACAVAHDKHIRLLAYRA